MPLVPVAIAAAGGVQSATALPPTAPTAVDPARSAAVRQLTAAELLRLADRAAAAGNRTLAERGLRALTADADVRVRNEARFRLAAMLAKSGELRDAALLYRRILDDEPDAARVRLELAGLLARMDDEPAALRELRAAQASSLPPHIARLVDRWSSALRARRPFGGSIEVALAPDSNVNRATRSDTLGTVIGDFEIGEEGQAKSGTGLALRGQAYRRFGLGDEASLLVRLGTSADLYRKSRFNDLAVDLAVGPELQLGGNRLRIEAGATQRWFGQKPFVRSARLAASLTRPLGDRTQLRLNASGALIDNRLNDLQDGKTYSGSVALEHALSATTGVGLSLAADRVAAKDPGYSTRAWRAGVFGWREVGRATLFAGVDYGRLAADERLLLFPDKRADRYSRFSLGASFRQVTFQGLAPFVRFSIERNRSSVEIYDYRRRRTEFGFTRAF